MQKEALCETFSPPSHGARREELRSLFVFNICDSKATD